MGIVRNGHWYSSEKEFNIIEQLKMEGLSTRSANALVNIDGIDPTDKKAIAQLMTEGKIAGLRNIGKGCVEEIGAWCGVVNRRKRPMPVCPHCGKAIPTPVPLELREIVGYGVEKELKSRGLNTKEKIRKAIKSGKFPNILNFNKSGGGSKMENLKVWCELP